MPATHLPTRHWCLLVNSCTQNQHAGMSCVSLLQLHSAFTASSTPSSLISAATPPSAVHTDGSDRFPRTGWTFGLFPGSGSYSKATTSVPALPPGQSGDKSPAHGQHRFGSSRGCQTAFLRWVPIPTLPVKERTPGAPCSHQHLSRPSTLATWGGGRWGR